MQMMLLEQQNKKRMRMAQQEQQSSFGGSGDLDDGNAETIVPELPSLGTQESEWTESVRSFSKLHSSLFRDLHLEKCLRSSILHFFDRKY